MANSYSKDLIREEFIRLLNVKSFNKITITEIAENCHLNRNTFYYYYSDLLSVLTEIFDDEIRRITSGYYVGKTWNETLLELTKFARENKNVVYHVYHSLQREELERFLYAFAGKVLTKFVDDKSKDMDVNTFDKALIVKFFQMALTGMLIEWINKGMKEDIYEVIDRMSLLLDGDIRMFLEKSQTN